MVLSASSGAAFVLVETDLWVISMMKLCRLSIHAICFKCHEFMANYFMQVQNSAVFPTKSPTAVMVCYSMNPSILKYWCPIGNPTVQTNGSLK